jgi:hypothetical protein
MEKKTVRLSKIFVNILDSLNTKSSAFGQLNLLFVSTTCNVVKELDDGFSR